MAHLPSDTSGVPALLPICGAYPDSDRSFDHYCAGIMRAGSVHILYGGHYVIGHVEVYKV
ncbi:MAG TPA: hypothetical protein VM537_13150 [Anaerolineae bacterium]|nr:hypothetical protein [Anaerolineae bacterium]